MTTNTVAPYLNLPEDINPPKPGYFHDVFHLIHAYITLLTHVPESASPDRGLIKLYSYRMGTLEFDTSIIEEYYLNLLTVGSQRTKLQNFAQSSIALNVQTLYQVVTNTLVKDILRKFGDDNCMSSEAIHAMNHFAKLQSRTDNDRVRRYDSMRALVETCHYNATYPRGGVSSSQAILRVIEVLDNTILGMDLTPPSMTRERLINALRIVFYIGCRYYHLNLLRFSDEIIGRSYDRKLDISDLTLASTPFDPTMIYNCADETSSISRWGIEYLQSLETVMLHFAGIEYTALLAVDANANKGVENV